MYRLAITLTQDDSASFAEGILVNLETMNDKERKEVLTDYVAALYTQLTGED